MYSTILHRKVPLTVTFTLGHRHLAQPLWALSSTVTMSSGASTGGTPGKPLGRLGPPRARLSQIARAMEHSDSDNDASDSDAEVERSWTMKPKLSKPWIYERVRAYDAEEWAQRFGSNLGHLPKEVCLNLDACEHLYGFTL